MARGYFKVDRHGYGYVLDAAPEIGNYCQLVGERIAQSASTQSGAGYVVDTRHGWTRYHTRVSTSARAEDGSWSRDFFREDALRALPVALTQWGGKLGSFKLRPRPYKTSKRKRR